MHLVSLCRANIEMCLRGCAGLSCRCLADRFLRNFTLSIEMRMASMNDHLTLRCSHMPNANVSGGGSLQEFPFRSVSMT